MENIKDKEFQQEKQNPEKVKNSFGLIFTLFKIYLIILSCSNHRENRWEETEMKPKINKIMWGIPKAAASCDSQILESFFYLWIVNKMKPFSTAGDKWRSKEGNFPWRSSSIIQLVFGTERGTGRNSLTPTPNSLRWRNQKG